MKLYKKRKLKKFLKQDGVVSTLPRKSFCEVFDLVLHCNDPLLTLVILNKLAGKGYKILVNQSGDINPYEITPLTANVINNIFNTNASDYGSCVDELLGRFKRIKNDRVFRLQNGAIFPAEFKSKKESCYMILSVMNTIENTIADNKLNHLKLKLSLSLNPLRVREKIKPYHSCYGQYEANNKKFVFYSKAKSKLMRIFNKKLQFILTQQNIDANQLGTLKSKRFNNLRIGEGMFPSKHYGKKGELLNLFAALSIDEILVSEKVYKSYKETLPIDE